MILRQFGDKWPSQRAWRLATHASFSVELIYMLRAFHRHMIHRHMIKNSQSWRFLHTPFSSPSVFPKVALRKLLFALCSFAKRPFYQRCQCSLHAVGVVCQWLVDDEEVLPPKPRLCGADWPLRTLVGFAAFVHPRVRLCEEFLDHRWITAR